MYDGWIIYYYSELKDFVKIFFFFENLKIMEYWEWNREWTATSWNGQNISAYVVNICLATDVLYKVKMIVVFEWCKEYGIYSHNETGYMELKLVKRVIETFSF